MIRKRQSGFTLLEAIVAMVVFASVGTALFAWLGTNLNTVHRIQAIQTRDAAVHIGLEWVETLNPMREPQGSVDFDSYRIQWQSQALEPRRDGVGQGGSQSLYQVALYTLQVVVQPAGLEPVEFTVRRVGYEQVRSPEFD